MHGSSNIDERISHYEQLQEDLKSECVRAEMLFDRIKRQRKEIELFLDSKAVREVVREEVKTIVTDISKSLDKDKVVETIGVLNRTYPNGWRTGDPTSDAMTVILINGIREIGKTLFEGD
jgi:hypothetical protein